MATSRAFSDVTVKVVNRIRQVAHDEHGVVFDPLDGTTGTATARTGIGDCVVHFVHDSVQSVPGLDACEKADVAASGAVTERLASSRLQRCKRGKTVGAPVDQAGRNRPLT